MPVTTERRNRTRTRPLGLVYAELGPSNGGMMRDLSEEGFAMRAMMPLRVGDITPFTLQLDAMIRLEGQCQVIWVREEGRLLGLRFVDTASKIRGQIRSWLALPEEIEPDASAAPAEVHQRSTMDELREEMRSIGPREESPHEDLKILQPPVAIESATSSEPSAPPPIVLETLSEPEPAVAAPETILPALPPLQLGRHWSLSGDEIPGPSNQHNEIPELFSPTQEAETFADFQSRAPSLEPLSIFEQRNSSRAAGTGKLGNFTLSAAIGIMLCIALLISGFVFHQELGRLLIWLGQKVSGTENVQAPAPAESHNSPVAPATREENPSPQNPKQEVAGANPNGGKQTDSAPVAENIPKPSSYAQTLAAPQKQSQIPSALTPMTQTNKPASAPALAPDASPSSAPAGTNVDGGYQEFQAARAILRSDTREGELPDAVRLLWASIEKGNTGAEVALAELYRTGRGVSKNCDQARVLLSAAANRGNPDAKRELTNLTAEGCR